MLPTLDRAPVRVDVPPSGATAAVPDDLETRRDPLVSVVIPALNEADNLPVLHERLAALMERLGIARYEMLVVDDGSTDATLAVLRDLAKRDPRVRYASLTRNFGHQPALRAGLDLCSGDCVLSMDADLQHPPELLEKMLAEWRAGHDVVATIRVDTARTSAFKRFTGSLFYRLVNLLGEHRIEPGSADFYLLDRSVVDAIRGLPETELFFRGLLPWLGFRTIKIRYTPDQRLHGSSKYSVRKMVNLAVTGVLSTSVQPLRLAILMAVIVAGLTLLYAAYAVVVYFTFDHVQPGWASVIMVVSALGAMQLLVLGIIGEYLGRVLREARGRPSYLVRATNCRRQGEGRRPDDERPAGAEDRA
jgi:dolichol-phosphate mannosyltransferase